MTKTETTTPKNIPLASIIVDYAHQARVELDQDTVEAYAEDLKVLPPVTVFQDPDAPKTRHLADGFHRYEAHQQQGAVRIKATILPGTAADALDFALGANASHGLRRTIADKRNAALLALGAHEDWADRKLARLCNVTNHFIARVRAEGTRQDGINKVAANTKANPSPTQAMPGDANMKDLMAGLPTQHDRDGNPAPALDAPPESAAVIFQKADLAMGAVQRRLDELGDLLGKKKDYKFCMDQIKAAITGLGKWETQAKQWDAGNEPAAAPTPKAKAKATKKKSGKRIRKA